MLPLRLTLLLSVAIAIGYADQSEETKLWIEPPMPLTQHIPITISDANRARYLENPEGEADRITQALNEKAVPWIGMLAAMAVAIGIILIKSAARETSSGKEPSSVEEEMKRVWRELHQLKKVKPKSNEEIAAYFVVLDRGLRTILDHRYSLNASTSTADELAAKTKTIAGLSSKEQQDLSTTLLQAEKVMFGKIIPSQSAVETASLVIDQFVLLEGEQPK